MNAWKATTTEELEGDAIKIANKSDFGNPGYRTGLAVLLKDFEKTARFSEAGAAAARGMLVGLLVQRLNAQARLTQNPAPAAIKRPWVILSMPRSGTTALHRMLCADPAAQGLNYWLATNPQPRPPIDTWPDNPDFQATAQMLEARRLASPNVFAQHEMRADLVDECGLVFNQHFANMGFFSLATAPNYAEWLWTCDMTSAYEWHSSMLGLIDGGCGKRWVLKDPSHLMSLDALIAAYPDLRVICTRRSPEAFLPSVSSLVYEARQAFEPTTSREVVAREALGTWSRTAHALHRWRAANSHVPWIDVDLHDLKKDPIAACRAIYEAMDEPFTAEAEAAIGAAVKEGVHAGATFDKQTLERYGLDRDEITAAFPQEFL